MATHGTEDAARRHQEYIRGELASVSERLRTVEDRLAQVMRDLAHMEDRLGVVGE